MELPEDMVGRILSKLHPFEVVKAKLVCRTWRRLISTMPVPSSALGFAIDSPLSSSTLMYADLSCSRWVGFPLLDEPASLIAIASPFLCLSTTSSSKPHVAQLHLLNPLTRVHVCIEPSLSRMVPFLVGLCTAPPIGGFKVVIAGQKAVADRSRRFDMDLDLPVQVFDSASFSWRRAGYVLGAAPEYASPVCLGSRIYWLARKGSRSHVLVFDAVDESWNMLRPSWPQELIPFTLWVWDGHLCMAGEISNALTVWKLAVNKCEWLMHTRIPSNVVDVDNFCGVKDVAGHGHLLCIMLVWARKGIVYDLRSGRVSRLPYCPVSAFSWGNVHPYMPGFSHL
ncbi:hypothetical protein GOP47_0030485 [Adiantum capillus-veneris]|nr:hypothetical protein GOP47_0030485 [Adiantum capillus-veneris]